MDEGTRKREAAKPAAGWGGGTGEVPRGIEVLIRKASVDAEFRRLLLEERSRAAEAIGLKLHPAEAMLLDGIPGPQLEAVVRRTTVEPENRKVFMGRVAAAMLVVLGVSTSCIPLSCGCTVNLPEYARSERKYLDDEKRRPGGPPMPVGERYETVDGETDHGD